MSGLWLRIMTLNHEDGGGEPGDWRRLDAQLKLAATERPDVVFSTEAKHWLANRGEGLERARKALGMTPHVARAPRHDCNLVIWTRPEAIRVRGEHHQTMHPFWHALAAVEADIVGFTPHSREPVWLIAVHLSPFDEALRNGEARALREFEKRLTIIGGDFQDEGVGDRPTSWKHLPVSKQERHRHHDGTHPALIMQTSGYLDIGTAVIPDPGRREPTAGFKDGAPVRCDRLLVSERMARCCPTMSYRVLPYKRRLSDHRAVTAALQLA